MYICINVIITLFWWIPNGQIVLQENFFHFSIVFLHIYLHRWTGKYCIYSKMISLLLILSNLLRKLCPPLIQLNNHPHHKNDSAQLFLTHTLQVTPPQKKKNIFHFLQYPMNWLHINYPIKFSILLTNISESFPTINPSLFYGIFVFQLPVSFPLSPGWQLNLQMERGYGEPHCRLACLSTLWYCDIWKCFHLAKFLLALQWVVAGISEEK